MPRVTDDKEAFTVTVGFFQIFFIELFSLINPKLPFSRRGVTTMVAPTQRRIAKTNSLDINHYSLDPSIGYQSSFIALRKQLSTPQQISPVQTSKITKHLKHSTR